MATKSPAPKLRKPVDARRTRAFTVRFNDEEAETVQRAAKADHVDVGTWLRQVGCRAAEKRLEDS